MIGFRQPFKKVSPLSLFWVQIFINEMEICVHFNGIFEEKGIFW